MLAESLSERAMSCTHTVEVLAGRVVELAGNVLHTHRLFQVKTVFCYWVCCRVSGTFD
jgi:hypothetical protein